MGLVSDYMRQLVSVQVATRKLVVWFDPEGQYSAFAGSLELPGACVMLYKDSFFALRHKIDRLLGGTNPPSLLVYVPMDEHSAGQALVELTMPGAVLSPQANSAEQKTSLAFVTRQALLAQGDKWTEQAANEIARQIEEGQISTLEDADRVAERGGEAAGVIPVIFGTGSPAEVALTLLDGTGKDAAITSKGAIGAIATLLGATYGRSFSIGSSPQEVREQLARHVLCTEFVATLHGALPQQLSGLTVAAEGAAREACVSLTRTWRLRRDLRESYAKHARRVERELALHSLRFTLEQLWDCETFLETETQLMRQVEGLLAGVGPIAPGQYTRLQDLVKRRLVGYWSLERYAEVGARWNIILACLNLVFTASTLESELKTAEGKPEEFVKRYTQGPDVPWCMLDTYQRHLGRRCHDFDFASGQKHSSLNSAINRARELYMQAGGALSERFLQALAEAKFQVGNVPQQRHVFDRFVAPGQRAGEKTAYVLVDALRYEMARELAASLDDAYEVSLAPALATVPTVTDIGMAALMPGVEQGQVVAGGDNKLGLAVGERVLRDRQSRMQWFQEQVPGRIAITRLEDVLPKPKRDLEDKLLEANMALVTSQEIDEFAERDNIHAARQQMDAVLPELSRLVNKLRDYGYRRIVISADHGYLFGDELESDMKIEPPGGQTLDLHRRVWVGKGGRKDDAFLRAPLKLFGLSDEWEIAVPRGFGAFTVRGGARAYFHGGMSLQEMVVPVMTLNPKGMASSAQVLACTLRPGSRKISARVFSVLITGAMQAATMFDAEPPRIRLEIRAKGLEPGLPDVASYGFLEATREVQLRFSEEDPIAIDPNTAIFRIEWEHIPKTASIYMLEATTGRTLAHIESIDVTISE